MIDVTGAAVPDAQVTLRREAVGFETSVRTDAAGQFRVEAAEGRRPVMSVTKCLVAAFCLGVAALGFAEEPLITGGVRGRVLDTTGGVLPGAEVQLAGRGSPASAHASTDEAGRYRFERLAAGDYQLTVRLSGFATRTLALQVSAGAETIIDVTLQPSRPRR